MLKRSKQKEAILEVLRGTNAHPDASWVYDRVRREIPNISLATVYRNLRLLRDTGYILQVDLSGEPGHFDGKTNAHYHVRCEKCGRIMDLDVPVRRSIEIRVAKKTGFKVSGHKLEVFGVCPECQ